MSDPVKDCEVYRDIGCSHVDGFLCDFPKCSIRLNYVESVSLEEKKTYYSEEYDAFYDPVANVWLDSKCSDPTCEFCNHRPETPLPPGKKLED